MEEAAPHLLDSNEDLKTSCGSDKNDDVKLINLHGNGTEEKETTNDNVFRERKTSGFSLNEFISRNGWNVEKLPTFHHIHVHVLDFQDKIHSEFVRQWRSVVTGDPNK